MVKRPRSFSIDVGPVPQAREPNINQPTGMEAALQELTRGRENWLANAAEAVAAYNRHIDEHGAFSDRLRSF